MIWKKIVPKSQKYFAVMSSVRRRKKQHGDLWNSSFLGKNKQIKTKNLLDVCKTTM